MPFCTYCGEELPDKARFCYMCGKPVRDVAGQASDSPKPPAAGRVTTGGERMLSCPNCGSAISRFDAVCPYCGSQVVDREASATVRQFAEALSQIEAQSSDSDTVPSVLKAFGMSQQLLDKGFGNRTFERKLSLIRSFPIPNTVEEISEFVLLAAANIDVRFGKKSLSNKLYGKPGSTYYTDITLANAWISKMQQAYQKAEIAFPSDPIFPKIRKIYQDKMAELGYKV